MEWRERTEKDSIWQLVDFYLEGRWPVRSKRTQLLAEVAELALRSVADRLAVVQKKNATCPYDEATVQRFGNLELD